MTNLRMKIYPVYIHTFKYNCIIISLNNIYKTYRRVQISFLPIFIDVKSRQNAANVHLPHYFRPCIFIHARPDNRSAIARPAARAIVRQSRTNDA